MSAAVRLESALAGAEKFIRPSNTEQLSECNGAAIMQAAAVARFGEPKTAPEASTGDIIHGAVASMIRRVVAGEAWGDAIATECNALTLCGVDHWSVWCAQWAGETARDLAAKYEIEPDNILVEHHLDMQAFGFRQGGTADLVLVVPFKLVVVVDWKAGFNDQGDATDHDQLMVYACAAAATFKAKEVIVVLGQPRNDAATRITVAEFKRADLLANEAWTREVTAAARNPEAEVTASYAACKYCKALLHCPVAKEFIMKAIAILEHPLGPQTPEDWTKVADAVALAGRFNKDGKALVKEQLWEAGPNSVPGWKLQEGAEIFSIEDGPAALKVATDAGMLELVAPAVSLSLSKLKAAIGETRVGELFTPFITSRQNEASLKPDKKAKKEAVA